MKCIYTFCLFLEYQQLAYLHKYKMTMHKR